MTDQAVVRQIEARILHWLARYSSEDLPAYEMADDLYQRMGPQLTAEQAEIVLRSQYGGPSPLPDDVIEVLDGITKARVAMLEAELAIQKGAYVTQRRTLKELEAEVEKLLNNGARMDRLYNACNECLRAALTEAKWAETNDARDSAWALYQSSEAEVETLKRDGATHMRESLEREERLEESVLAWMNKAVEYTREIERLKTKFIASEDALTRALARLRREDQNA